MKVKTSITLSENLIKAIDQRVGSDKTRSAFIEKAMWVFITQMILDEQNARDLDIINRRAERLNREAADVLEYQTNL